MNFYMLYSNRLSPSLLCKQWLELSQYTLRCQTYLIFLILHSRLASWASGNTSDVYSVKSCDIDTRVTAESRLLHLTRLWWGCHHIKGRGRTCSVVVNAKQAWAGRSLLFAHCTLRKKLNNLSKYPQAGRNASTLQHTDNKTPTYTRSAAAHTAAKMKCVCACVVSVKQQYSPKPQIVKESQGPMSN